MGHVEDFDVDRCRIQVLINWLKPLEMKLDISLPSGEIKKVELEFESLQKHCFSCLSLSHEVKDCSSSRARVNSREYRAPPLGISQNQTLEKLEADKRRNDENKGSILNPGSDFRTNWGNRKVRPTKQTTRVSGKERKTSATTMALVFTLS